jgi:hypothetical protein
MKGSFFKLAGNMPIWLADHIFRSAFGAAFKKRMRKTAIDTP